VTVARPRRNPPLEDGFAGTSDVGLDCSVAGSSKRAPKVVL